MKKKFMIVLIILLLVSVGFTGCIGQASKDFNEEYETNENTVLKVANINGKVEIIRWDGNTVTLDAKISSYKGNDELEKIEINVIESDNVIDIETKYLGTGSVEVSTDMIIKVPTLVKVEMVTTSNGDVRISGIKGNTTVHSSNGAITITDVDGYVTAGSSNGDIEIIDTTGIADLDTSNGDIYAEIFSFKENITIDTSNGGISVYINPSLNADIEMKTSNGDISISDVLLDLTISEEDYKVGRLGEGGNKLDINTSNGNINLYKLNI
jgi:DUF4097 and DUF4098 domain-containing protein YvlB